MTCFWDGILNSLQHNDFKIIGINKPNNIDELINVFKSYNIKPIDITWNGNILKEQEMKEHMESIKVFDSSGKNSGYFCSTCDSFLLLLCQLLHLNVIHKYRDTLIKYIHKKKTMKTLYFGSDNGHFWFNKRLQ